MGRHSASSRAAGPVDRDIGQRIRARRLAVGMSQEALAAKLGVSFQQVQKYEKGTNRIAATMLINIAEALDSPVAALLRADLAIAIDGPADQDSSDLVALLTQLTPQGRRLIATIARVLLEESRLAKPGKRAPD